MSTLSSLVKLGKTGLGVSYFKQHGGFSNTEKALTRSLSANWAWVLNRYGQEGVLRLMAATPVDTGYTASCWKYDLVQNGKNSYSVVWSNTNVVDGVNIALIVDIGHGTRNGGYVVGAKYIDPALEPIFEDMANAAWKEVSGQ